ncbi:MAG TPA: ATP-binding protein [Gemmatimonadaceae bacterium]|nr:ATP-binding protein [Gemmatimonadaceae bacterium]
MSFEHLASKAPREQSLERTLPLFIMGMLLLVIGAAFVVTGRELLRSARIAAAERLRNVTRELAASAESSAQQHARTVRGAARDPVIRRALAGDSVAPAELDSALHRIVPAGDSAVAIGLWRAGGAAVSRRVLVVQEGAPEQRGGVMPTPGDSARYGPLYLDDGRVYYWVVAPVGTGAHPAGWIAERRRLTVTAGAVRQINALVGRDVGVYFRNDTGSLWATLSGAPARPSESDGHLDGIPLRRRRDRPTMGPLLLAEAPIRGTPWTLALELPVGTATTGARATLARLAMVNLVLLLVAAVAAWALSRRLTRPLVQLTHAAAEIARGAFTPIHERWAARGDEVGRLAAGFNRMASEVAASRAALEQQVKEAQTLGDELERANAELQESTLRAEHARVAAEEANRAKSEFLAMMSHELRTPLNAIAGYTELLQLGIHGPLTTAQHEDLERIRHSQRTLLTLIDDVLNYARIEAGRVEYAVSEIPLDETLAGMEALIAPQARVKGITYEHRPAGAAVRVWADRRKLEQIVLNLLSNAVKFTGRGGRITVDGTATGDHVLVRVTDTGCGIAPDKLESIFEPFTQAEAGLTRTSGGTGLGLAICREFARAMGGDVYVERSAEPGGSTFAVRLLARAPREGGAIAAASAPDRASDGGWHAPRPR